MTILAIIQGRVGSTRLPGKILKKINNKTILNHVYTRIKKSKLIDKIVIATSINKENNIVEDLCYNNSILCFRGSEDDVLDRYYQCAKYYGCLAQTTIVRITGDCPLIDSEIIDKVIDYYNSNNYDIVMNTWFKNGYPSGYDVEVFSYDTLYKQWLLEKDMKKREHVMCTMTNNNFIVKNFTDLSDNFINSLYFDFNYLHLSVDTQKDFDLVKIIIETLGNDTNFNDIIIFFNNNPELIKYNLDDIKLKTIKKLKS
jgi:spore coat polysaccharide biosynthesis protein SpsF